MAIPNFQTLMLPVLQAASAGEVRIGDERAYPSAGIQLPG